MWLTRASRGSGEAPSSLPPVEVAWLLLAPAGTLQLLLAPVGTLRLLLAPVGMLWLPLAPAEVAGGLLCAISHAWPLVLENN